MEIHNYNWDSIVKTVPELTLSIFVALGLKVSASLSIKWGLVCSLSRVFKSMFSDCQVPASRGSFFKRLCALVACLSFSNCEVIVMNLPACLIPETLGQKAKGGIKMQILYMWYELHIIHMCNMNYLPQFW